MLECESLLESFDTLVDDAFKFGGIVRGIEIDPADKHVLITTALVLILHNAAAFDRRIVAVYTKCHGCRTIA